MTVTLPVPSFVERDPVLITQALVERFEEIVGRTLQPAQVERLLIELMAYRETLVRIAIQEAAEQNLVAFARYPMLDFLGEIVGALRLPAAAASTTLRFTLVGVQAVAVTVPVGTRVRSGDGRVVFATDDDLVIPSAATYGDVSATAAAEGAIGNGYIAGTVTSILDPVALVATAANTTTSQDGAETEDDDAYRERIRQAPERFSVAGSTGAYRYHALSVSGSIIDVAVSSITMGVVRVCVLTSAGIPSGALLSQVAAALSADTVRPLTDTVEVVAPTEVNFVITATVRPLAGVDVETLMTAVAISAAAYADDRRAGLGRSIIRSQIVAALSIPGVYQVTLTAPAADTELTTEEWANCTAITLTEGAPGGG